MPILLMARHIPVVSGATTVGGGVASGAEIAGSIGGVVGALVAVAGLFLAIAGNNAKRRREYEREIREAETRGAERLRDDLEPRLERAERDMEFWRGIAMADRGGAPVPIPPSQQHRTPPTRPDTDEEQD